MADLLSFNVFGFVFFPPIAEQFAPIRFFRLQVWPIFFQFSQPLYRFTVIFFK